MRRIAFFCLTIAALSTTIITAGTESALATKPNKDVVTKKDLVAKKDLVTKKDLAAKTDKAPRACRSLCPEPYRSLRPSLFW